MSGSSGKIKKSRDRALDPACGRGFWEAVCERGGAAVAGGGDGDGGGLF